MKFCYGKCTFEPIFKFNEIPYIFQSNSEALTIAKNSEFETIDQLKQGNIYLYFSFRKK